MGVKLRKILSIGTILYTLLILYFLFFAFNRVAHQYSEYGYTFMWIPEGVPLLFPNLSDLSFSWIYDLGNVVAFIPFGILIPLLYPSSFKKFILMFIISIFVLETLQSLTFLGTFDVSDIISNTLGATIGYCAYRIGFITTITWRSLVKSALTVVVLLIAIMGISEIIDFTLEKKEGVIHGLQEVKELTGNMPITQDLPSLTITGKTINPKMNLYSSEGEETHQYKYILGDKKEILLYLNFAFPVKDDSSSELIIVADDNVIFQTAEQYSPDIELINTSLITVNELTIILKGNVKLWDVGFSEMKHWWE
ncbi:glycopeptide antibiotics resistance protein [Paenibacillus sp. PastF-3]|uniref:VanZ family protein n=1 Tax=Paenibacillus sp. PastF-3 TaxID=2940626 RepID=UPI0024732FA5|nr:VanZ family protein [Paenibacillus sp. PastF-3]MDH6368778.1 glycopeptide antibiotics resistance protein [Paenibacillus sp. PastF-3]